MFILKDRSDNINVHIKYYLIIYVIFCLPKVIVYVEK
jgi:hypothetical protein